MTEVKKCENPEFKGEPPHLLYCMGCDDCYLCTEEHSCEPRCFVGGMTDE